MMQLKYYLQYKKVLSRSQIKQDFQCLEQKQNVSDFFQMLEQNKLWKICKIWAVWTFFLDNTLKILLQKKRFERFLNGLSKKTSQKARKIWTVFSGLSKKTAEIWAVFLDKLLKTVQFLRGFWAFFFR